MKHAAYVLLVPLLLGLSPSPQDPETELKSLITESTDLLVEYQAAVDGADFSLEARLRKISKDPLAIFTYVRDEIAYETYRGALRGPTGCLSSKAGNAVDKSLLLHSLLVLAGHKAEFAFGTLDGETAEQLALRTLTQETDEEDCELDLPVYIESRELEEEREKAVASLRGQLEGRHRTLLTALEKPLVGRLSAEGGGTATIDQLIAEARDHVWVRTELGGVMTALDPSFHEAEPGDVFATPTGTAATLPDSHWHELTFRVIVERFDGAKVVREPSCELTRRAADLRGQPVLFSLFKETGAAGFAGALGRAAGKDSRLVGLSIGGEVVAHGKFDFAEPKKAGGLAGAFGGGEAAGPFVAAVSIEIHSKAPGEIPPILTRYLYDLWGKDARAKSDVSPLKAAKADPAAVKQLESNTLCFGIETGVISPSLVQFRSLAASVLTFRSLAVAGGKVRFSPTHGPLQGSLIADAYFHLYDRMAASLLDRRGYAIAPRITLAIFDPAGGLVFDVTRDPQRFVEEGFDNARKSALEAGLLASIVEESLTLDPLSEVRVDVPLARRGSARMLEDTLARGPPILYQKPEDLPGVTPAARHLMELAFRAEKLVLLPSGSTTAWYEFDPVTGRLEATVESGMHQATSEKAVLEGKAVQDTRTAFTFGNAVRGLTRCVAKNIDSILLAVLSSAAGSLDYQSAMEAGVGTIACLKKIKAGPRKFNKGKNFYKGNKGHTSRNSRELGKNCKTPRKRDAHHIVPSTHRRAWEARKILEKFGIKINAKENGINLTKRQHKGVHTNRYIDTITDLLRGCKSKEEALEVLKKAGEALAGR